MTGLESGMCAAEKKPLYETVGTQIRQRILSRQYTVGSFLPIEEDLQSEFGASRTTVRKAVEILERQGLVKREQGRGTRVCSLNPKQDLNYLSSITETLKNRYGHVGVRGVSVSQIPPTQGFRDELGTATDAGLYVVQRSLIVNDMVVAFLKNVIVAKHVPNLETQKDFIEENGLYKTLEVKYGLVLDYAIENISVYMSGPLESSLFEVSSPIPLLFSRRKTFLVDGETLESDYSFVRADCFEYTVYLKGRTPPEDVVSI